jgi:hypothetical protein
MRVLLVCIKGSRVRKEEMSKVIRRIELECWREALVFKFLYNLLAKSKKRGLEPLYP